MGSRERIRSRRTRPFGVTLLAVWEVISGVQLLLTGLVLIGISSDQDPGSVKSLLFVLGLALALLAVSYFLWARGYLRGYESARRRGRLAATAVIILAILASMDANRPHVLIHDPVDESIPADFDGLMLRGDLLHGNVFHIELEVRGTIQPNYTIGTMGGGGLVMSAYQVSVWCKEDSSGGPIVYLLKYINGVEVNYGAPVQADGGLLTFEFSTRILGVGWHIVGIEGTIFSIDSQDYIVEASADTLPVHKVLELPFSSYVLVAGACACLVAVTIVGLQTARKNPTPPPVH